MKMNFDEPNMNALTALAGSSLNLISFSKCNENVLLKYPINQILLLFSKLKKHRPRKPKVVP
jgi:hypothetical protein